MGKDKDSTEAGNKIGRVVTGYCFLKERGLKNESKQGKTNGK